MLGGLRDAQQNASFSVLSGSTADTVHSPVMEAVAEFHLFLLREMDVENVGFHTSPLYLAFSFGVLVSPELQKVSVFMVRQ